MSNNSAATNSQQQHSVAAQQSQSSSLSKLPPSFRKKLLALSTSDVQDQQSSTTMGIQEILHRTFESSSAASEASLSSGEGRRGFDLNWYFENKFQLFIHVEMDPLDIHAPSDAFVFSKDIIEVQIQQAVETEMERVSSLEKCFARVKAANGKPSFKFLLIPIKIIMSIDDRGNTKEIVLEACPPQTDNAPTSELMKQTLLQLSFKFPVVYRESFKRRDAVNRFWCCTLKEENSFDDVLMLSIEFQIQYYEEKVNKNTKLAWELIHGWVLKLHQFDLNDSSRFEVKLVAGMHRVGQTSSRVTHPKFYVTYNAPDLQSLENLCFLVGIHHGQTVRLDSKSAPGCAEGFDFRFYCTLFDPKVLLPRPLALKPTIEKVFAHLSPKVTPESILKLYILKHFPSSNFTVEELVQAPDLQMINSDLAKTISVLVEEGFIVHNRVHENILSISPLRRQWTDLTLILPDLSQITIQHKDAGIWLDISMGLPQDSEPKAFRCFAIHVALAYSAISRTEVSPWMLEEYMQYRFNQFKIALSHLRDSPYALSLMNQKYESARIQANDAEIDPDFIANPAFWLNLDRLEELAQCAGSESYVSMWGFLFLPTEFLQYNYFIINTKPIGDDNGFRAAKVVGGNFLFISDKTKASTITLRYEGDQSGHFSCLLVRQRPEEFKKKILSTVDVTQVKVKKVKSAMWDAIADIFMDLSLENFNSKSRPQIQIHVPQDDACRPNKAAEVHDAQEDDVSVAEAQNNSDEAADAQADMANSQASALSSRSCKSQKKIDKVKHIISSVFDICNQADELALLTPEDLSLVELEGRLRELDHLILSAKAKIEGCPELSSQEQSQESALLVEYQTLNSLVDIVVELRSKFLKAIDSKKATAKRNLGSGGKGKPSKSANGQGADKVPNGPLDLFCKVRSYLPVDDVSDQIIEGKLLDLFVIEPTPTFIASLYLSILHASTNHHIILEMEHLFQQKLSVSKLTASDLCKKTRMQFDVVKNNPMVRGGKTFAEYLQTKGVSSWDKIAYDNVLGEITLCSQVWKLNIALVWRHDGLWRLFVATNGGASPILTVLYAKTKVVINRDGEALFETGSAGRFFPLEALHPDGEEWFENALFTSAIPDSAPVDSFEPIKAFQKHIDREFHFQSVVTHEGFRSPDTISEITAEAAESDLWNSFVDNDSVSQGSRPTPDEIRAIPLPVIVSTINESAKAALKPIVLRRKIVVTESQEESQHRAASSAYDAGNRGE
jgi:hypothetical protein